MNLRKQKELASRALGVSKKRIKFNLTAENKKDLKELISREGVKDLLADKSITKLPKVGNSRTRANYILSQKKKGT
jgi:ribosomal protein L19E